MNMTLDDQFADFVAIDEPLTRASSDGSRRRLDALAHFFPDGLDAGPNLSDRGMRLDALYLMAKTLHRQGFPGRALPVHAQHDELCRDLGPTQSRRLASALALHAESLRCCGRYHDADILAREGLDLQGRVGRPFHIAHDMFLFGRGLALRGAQTESRAALDEAITLFETAAEYDDEHATAQLCVSERAVLNDDPAKATSSLDVAAQLLRRSGAQSPRSDFVKTQMVMGRATQLRGEIARLQGEALSANSHFRTALKLTDDVNFVEGTITALLGLISLASDRSGPAGERRRWLDAVFQLTHQGPYRAFDSDAHLEVARLEVDLGNPEIARRAAQRAATLAWCDGPPFSYAAGYQRAGAELQLLSVAAPPPEVTDGAGIHQS